MEIIELETIKKNYKEKIKELEQKNELLMKVYNSFFKYFDKYKNMGNVIKAINKDLEQDKIIVSFYNSYGTEYLSIYNNEKNIKLSCYYEKENSLKDNWQKGFYREFEYDYIAKYKEELKVIDEVYKKYIKAMELLQEIYDNSPQVKEKIEFNIRNPSIYQDKPTYFLKDFLPLLKEL